MLEAQQGTQTADADENGAPVDTGAELNADAQDTVRTEDGGAPWSLRLRWTMCRRPLRSLSPVKSLRRKRGSRPPEKKRIRSRGGAHLRPAPGTHSTAEK